MVRTKSARKIHTLPTLAQNYPHVETTRDDKAGLLYGAPAIASFLGMRVRQVRHRIKAGQIPTFRIGATICARQAALLHWLEVEEQGA